MKNVMCCLFLLLPIFSFSQENTNSLKIGEKVVVQTVNKENYRGEIVTVTSEDFVLKTIDGEFKLKKSNIDSIKEDLYKGKYAFKNPNSTKYFIGSSAIEMEKGGFIYQNKMLGFNSLTYAFSNNFSLTGGLEFVSTLQGAPIWFLSPKYAVEVSEKSCVSISALIFGFQGEYISLINGNYTYGNSEGNISFGLGVNFENSVDIDLDVSETMLVTFSGMKRISRSIILVTENFIPYSSSGDYFGIHGCRVISKKNSFDFGLFLGGVEIGEIPYIGYTRSF